MSQLPGYHGYGHVCLLSGFSAPSGMNMCYFYKEKTSRAPYFRFTPHLPVRTGEVGHREHSLKGAGHPADSRPPLSAGRQQEETDSAATSISSC